MKFLLIIFSLIVNMNAYADSNWVYISTSNTNDVFFIDKNSIQTNGDSKTYWQQTNYGKRDKFGDLSSKAQSTINCRTREIINRYLMTYDDIKNMGRMTSSFDTKDSWMPIPPDTVNWNLFEYVCK
jgi:hypothetical protein